ncbi:MAG: GNAT family N-acetyltransferase [Actinomycetota bacterium]
MSDAPAIPAGVRIRLARPEDRGEIMMLYRRESRRPPDADRLRRQLEALPAVVAHEGNALVGFIHARRMAPDVAELSQMVVAARLRGRGVGGAMVAAMEEALRDVGVRAAVFTNSVLHPGNTREGSTRARRFWLRCGYWEVLQTEGGATVVFAKRLEG